MPYSRRQLGCALLVAAACTALAPMTAVAEDAWPSRPIRILAPSAAGGSLDVVARIVAQNLGEALGTTVVVENRGGANGTIGTNLVAKAAPDGYTMLMTTGQFTGSAVLYKKLPYDPVKDFAPITQIARSYGLVLAINTEVPARDLKDFIALAKKNPDSMDYGSAGEGNITHLAGALFNHLAGTSIQHVPYKGSGPALQDVAANQIDMTFVSTSGGLGTIKAGKVRALAISSPTRAPVLPDVPTFDEAGLPGMNMINGWYGLWYPAETPQPIIDRVQAAVAGFMAKPAVKAQFEDLGLIPMGTTPAEFSKFLQEDLANQSELVKIANVKQQ
ncbi:Bug family tripartite tricarboxylate transporter substrate binding protein [Aquabacter spiritensis]|uniref:Tripartite-type tricarboxylate transporter receptor subunit TctC n=1 Tax=Aquabacter spiritensis TaxID=933073 RepID=A0A4R3M2M7_9HYPH|nr:tripartite tricarboxylate transporter substrate binding protein [Aquabacter spiritensis]TCT05497.1 tripartite-type tricarboxylate transporter receptor subunit TctC [Aquabacter spiritensis]